MSTETIEKPEQAETPANNVNPGYYYPYAQPAGYAPYPPTYWQRYAPVRTSADRVVQVIFWLFYGLVGVWIDFSLLISYWTVALTFTAILPLVAIAKPWADTTNWGWDDGVVFHRFTDPQIYTISGLLTVVGIAMVVFGIFMVKPMINLHRAIFRSLGGLDI